MLIERMPSQGKGEDSMKMKAVLEELPKAKSRNPKNGTKIEVPSFLGEKIGKGIKIGMVNMDEDDDVSEWNVHGETIPINFDKVSQFFNWTDLFPEWIDEEEESDVPTCPELPMPEFATYENMDIIVAKLPCKYPLEGWGREVLRLQVHLIVANMVVKKGKKDWKWKSKVVFWSKCRPMLEIFRCDDLVKHEGDWWFYEVDVKKLEQKISLPVGSCNLALPLWEQGIDKVYDISKMEQNVRSKTRAKHEAYATVLHSSESYVCGAITLAQSLLKTGTNRDLILLIDSSISVRKRRALAGAGWKIRTITRIRNPRAENGTYNEYNYSKFRLWQLTDYEKIIFIDSDILVLRNLDILFNFPQMSATGNDQSIFNSGIMVIEPSNCTFSVLMSRRHDIVSYNGGDQGFLNEIFVWWHRLPRRVNYLKNFWANTTVEASVKNGLFAADPPKLYAIHYLGLKPWHCYRDYDCNWDVMDQRVYASDVAHQRWWNFHDRMDKKLQSFCRLTRQRRTELNWERRRSNKMGSLDYHWRINVTDPRKSGSLLMD
ncbi:UDP-glucuronate:xylan alpha-glucuronosyltransferase 2 isoform X2 [Medicago truncatula]|uniref:Hexosyltransferase n=1 Tax=Medicago truncatula TaxID=3880 RepID=G7I3L4_MEDTR|nr:UDP-glucuronate:xylan alpha-glucuronosyltransferase 2 isoform X2 [Medicago truncatula]AES59449.1 UDP-glucuronate:xylan alpha-glucuronosyltransferase [Medicago truncatula]